jgi:hypothetical protein
MTRLGVLRVKDRRANVVGVVVGVSEIPIGLELVLKLLKNLRAREKRYMRREEKGKGEGLRKRWREREGEREREESERELEEREETKREKRRLIARAREETGKEKGI